MKGYFYEIGCRCWTDSGGELRIPVPGQYTSPCPSPLPLPLSAEEVSLLEHCKTYGLPKPGKPKPVPDGKCLFACNIFYL